MDVVEIPTNRPIARIDHHDVVYKTKNEKYKAVVEEVVKSHEKGQPVLVGTITDSTTALNLPFFVLYTASSKSDVYKRQHWHCVHTT